MTRFFAANRQKLHIFAFMFLFTLLVSSKLTFGADFIEHDGCQSTRLGGNDRYQTCAAIASEAFPDGADEIILVTGKKFPDALSASAFAGSHNAPILLSRRNELPDPIRLLLTETWGGRAGKATIIGGGFSDAVIGSLRECGINEIDIIAGSDRYQTANLVCQRVLDSQLASDTCLIVTGQKAADALSASPWSYRYHMPILLAKNGALSAETKALVSRFPSVCLIGGESCCRTEEVTSLGIQPVRIAGSDRYETSAAVSAWFGNASASPCLAVAAGGNSHFPDALCGAMLAGPQNSPILLTRRDRDNQPVYGFINSHYADAGIAGRIYTLGSEGAVSAATENTVIGLFASQPVWVMTSYADRTGLQATFYTLFNEKDHQLIIVDGGWKKNADQVRSVINAYGGHVSAWILTHFHDDHVGAFNAIMDDPQGITVGTVYASPFDPDDYEARARFWDHPEYYEDFRRIAEDLPVCYVNRGDTAAFGNLTATFFNTYDSRLLETVQTDIPNNGSLVFKISGSRDSVLFCGDCCSDAVGDLMISLFGDSLKAEYVQAGHHGSLSFAASFYDYVSPSVMLFDAPNWLMTGTRYTAKDLKAYCDAAGIASYDQTTAPNEFVFY